MDQQGINDIVKKNIDGLPPLSPVIQKVMEITHNPKSSAQDLADVITSDPILSAKVLKMVNSAYFGGRQDFSNLKQTIVILGTNAIKNIALSSAVLSALRGSKIAPISDEEFWRYSFGVGIASKSIASLAGVSKQQLEEFFVAGLIHDIGKILLVHAFPNDYKKILDMSKTSKFSITQIEKKILGVSHEEIGEGIGKKWGFDKGYLNAIGHHHIPVTEGEFSKYSMIVGVASYMVSTMNIASINYGYLEPLQDKVWSNLGITQDQVVELLSSITEEIEKAKTFLD